MQVSFTRTGGFTGIPLNITVDTRSLPFDRANQLRHLVERASFFDLPAALPAPALPDRFQYEITAQKGDRQHTVTVSEATIPATLKPLIDWLMEEVRGRGR
ncbi:hypothetical protein C7B76_25085 [filamentous cyanobacterium CCP2]|nr:hypothetical protein C7B76_25085 [filamentous cyanobacterium CCP2]